MYKKIYDDLLEAIEKGIYPPGSKLPSEKELMEQYNVSRITSKKALEMLADRNIIVRMPGKGSFVLEENEQDRENLPAVPQTVEPVRKGKMLGVILDFFSGFFGCELIAGIEHECWSKNYHMILKCTYGNVEAESRSILEITFMYLMVLPFVYLSNFYFHAPFLLVFAFCYIDEPIRYTLMQHHLYSGKWIRPVSGPGLATIDAFRQKHGIKIKQKSAASVK